MSERSERGAGGRWPLAERSLVPTVLGLPSGVAVGLAAGLTAVGAVVDLVRTGGLGPVFAVGHVVGCLLAVTWVRRAGLFGPIVAPPLLAALIVPVAVLVTGAARTGAGLAERLLVVGAPLVNAFPVLAWTSGLVLAVGVGRIVGQRSPGRSAVSARTGPAATAAPEAARTSGSPPRS